MDAKITKQRLGNLLAYDWLKILAAVAAAVVALSLIFTMVGTRPNNQQKFSVFSYSDLSTGDDFRSLSSTLVSKKVLSYDTLTVSVESFDSNPYAGATFTARRAAGEGDVMFVSDIPVTGEDGKLDYSANTITALSDGIGYRGGSSVNSGFYDTEYFLTDCKNYLAGFFGGLEFDENSELNTDAVRVSFLARNGNDKRYRSEEKREAGIEQEEERILTLRESYLGVMNAFEKGKLSHVSYQTGEETYHLGISLAKLSSLGSLVHAKQNDMETVSPVALMIFHNSSENDLRFEAVFFLHYLVEKYGA